MFDFFSYTLDLKDYILRSYFAVLKEAVQWAVVVGRIRRCLVIHLLLHRCRFKSVTG